MKQRIYFLAIFSFLFSFAATAQQNHFVYIQSDNKQPFYVKIDKAVLSSSALGYLIIPKLKDGSYQLNIGFPKNEWPQQSIMLRIDKKDAGYALKNFGDKGWGLFNLQTMEVIMAKNANVKADANTITITDDDPFTQVLSDVVNTPDLKKKTLTEPPAIVKKEEPKKEQPVPVAPPAKDESTAKTEMPAKTNEVKQSVRLLLNNKNNKGREMIYIDEAGNDTIRIFIPVVESLVSTSTKVTDNKALKPGEKFMDIELQNPNARADSAKQPATADLPVVKESPGNTKAVSMVNSDCKANASENDFMKLRRKMAAAKTDEDMVNVSRKAFKSKCYSTSQVKNLSVLFLNDEGRYQFFDAAYPFVYDTGNFSSLEQQLTDPYYITRFQAMIRQ
jgi:Domain of unknown function (DUF4476)